MENSQLKHELLQATDGLYMLSETDAPFEFFYHEKPDKGEPFTPELVVEWDGKPAGTSIETMEIDAFLHRMKKPHAEADETQRQNAARFIKLEETLKRNLRNVKAYKISQTSMPVYLLGETETGDYAGLKTLVVET